MICKSTAVWTLFIFVLGWIAGSLFFVSYMALNDIDLTSTSKSSHMTNSISSATNRDYEISSHFNSNNAYNGAKNENSASTFLESTVTLIKSIKSEFTSIAPTLPPLHKAEEDLNENGEVPKFHRNSNSNSVSNSSGQDDDEVKTWIHLDWPVDDRLFTFENYKVLESIMSVYPSATIRVWITAPQDAYVHKIGNQLSISHFDKYRKRGYTIDAQPVGKMNKGFISQIGKDYWNKYGSLCCYHCGPTCRKEDHIQPYHVLNYIRLNKLWKNGGIVSDFSFFFFGNLNRPNFRQGFHINSYCDHGDDYQDWEIEQQNNPHKFDFVTKKCFTSTLLVFNEEKSEAILCVLKQYESKDFLHCIESDAEFEGAGCILTAFTDCFETLGITNDLYIDTDIYSNTNNAAAVLSGIKLLNWNGDNKHKIRPADSSLHPSPLEVFNDNPAIARSMLVLSDEWRLKRHIRVMWMGDIAFKGAWSKISKSAEEDKLIESSHSGSSVRLISSKSLLAKAISTIQLKPMNFNDICSYIPNDFIYSSFDHDNSTQKSKDNLAENTCSHYSKKLSALVNEEKSLSFNTNMEDLACAPNIVIPGFMKSASSFLFTLLNLHPLILRPLKGSQLKETHCYHGLPKRKLLHRMWCYPYVGEEDGHFDIEADELVSGIEQIDASEEESSQVQPFIESDNANEIESENELEVGHRNLASLRGAAATVNPSPVPSNQTTTAGSNLNAVYSSLSSTMDAAAASKEIDPEDWKKMIMGMKRGFSILDGTIYYGTDAEAAMSLVEDNKNVKAIFVVRHPVDRIYSNYKFALETYQKKGSFDNFTMQGTSRMEKFGQMRDMIVNGSDNVQVLNTYFNQSFAQGALGILFMHSIVYPSILHYQNTLGKHNVLVLTSEDLEINKAEKINKLARVQATMNKVFNFLNLCPIKIPDSIAPVLEGRNRIPEELDMSQDVYNKLNKFFSPFNDALARLVPSINISHWNTKPAPKHLRKYTYNSNTTLPEMWFEAILPTATANTGFGKIVSHLLPVNKKDEEEDAAFNTTLGMLVSFR